MTTLRAGVQLQPQGTSVEEMRRAWRAADEMGVDSIWVWDHFLPIYGDPDATHFEAYTLLAAMAVETSRADVGVLVTGNPYRNPNLLADMVRTVDHLSGGRAVLGIGAAWAERDFAEYGYEFEPGPERLASLEENLRTIRARFEALNPAPVRPVPILVGGAGEKVTLRIVAENADIWNGFRPVDEFAAKNRVLDEWCDRVGRDPASIERSVSIEPEDVERWQDFVEAGATHLIIMTSSPFDLDPAQRLLDAVRSGP